MDSTVEKHVPRHEIFVRIAMKMLLYSHVWISSITTHLKVFPLYLLVLVQISGTLM